ncbi:hypothetical protein RBWH47_01534 [Rhodopirellula baltica WH47]|uniref:Uncharacterized protein n=2 Tax=Rhodopirellula baltica TaxID=265606 RepID=F2AKF6_RHOBT|nr:hypothetical protein RBWH47_01534 [Rhodopirellula baltica WH47]
MALFVHLAPENDSDSIRRSGIKTRRVRNVARDGYDRIVFAMPVTNDFYVSHQWLRELKRSGQRTIVGVYFRIPDDQLVLVGHYNQAHTEMTANEAVGVVFNAEQPEGFEVIIPRKIEAKEIHKINTLPQVLGWRYYPGAKGRKPCGCPYCTKGDIKSKRIRDEYERSFDN